jgi:hypothetical protein
MTRIDKLTLEEYIAELSAHVLDKNWAHQTRQQILSARQPEGSRFVDWRIEMENLNAVLTTSAQRFALTPEALRGLLEANARAALATSLAHKPIDATLSYQDWSDEVHSRDQDLRDEEKRLDAQLTVNRNAYREKKTLLQRMESKPTGNGAYKTSASNNTDQTSRATLPKLTDEDRRLLDEHEGCRRCRVFYTDHRGDNCPMKKTNTWPDPATYKPLTQAMALAAKPKRVPVGYVPDLTTMDDDEADGEFDDEDGFYDEETYALPADNPPPFTMPHLYAHVLATSPSDPNSTVSTKCLLDVGCPSTVISGRLATKLGLRRYPLPKREDNLSSLSGTPLSSLEFVELVITQSRGSWRSKVIRAKVNEELPIPLILGIPFLAYEHIVIDVEARTAIVRESGHDLLNPLIPRIVYDCLTPGARSQPTVEMVPESRARRMGLDLAAARQMPQAATIPLTPSESTQPSPPPTVRAHRLPAEPSTPTVPLSTATVPPSAATTVPPSAEPATTVPLPVSDALPTSTAQPSDMPTAIACATLPMAPETPQSKENREIMAAVRERIEVLAFQEQLRVRDEALKAKYADCFPTRLPDVGNMPDHIYHRIRLRDKDKIVKGRGYVAPKKHHDAWKRLLDEHLAAGRIRPSASEHASPAFIIPKYKGGVPDPMVPPRWVNNYCELNSNTIRDNYPLPRVDEILADCGKGKIFGKLDMTNSFFQTRVHPDDIHLTAVRTPWGLYEWVVMPMGGCNAPSTHQRRMTDALRPYIGKICHVYLDDIIIWSQTIEEHERNVELVLEALRASKLYCNVKKTSLFCTEVDFLGHVISRAGIQADPRKGERVLNWPVPTTATNVRGFLGLTRYLSAFLPGLAEHTSILTPLTTAEADRDFPGWTDEHQHAFEAIKELVTGAGCLTVIDYDDDTKKIFVTTDASNRRTGAVLSFGETWETARPVAYDSYQLNAAERNYPTHEKELLAIIKALKKYRTYLLGTTFEVYTDHRTLEFFQSQKETSSRQKRWAMTLADFDFTIIYIRGEDNSAADALSRMPDDEPNPGYAACALAYTRTSSSSHLCPLADTLTAAALQISADQEFVDRIKAGYLTDTFAIQVRAGIAAGSTVSTREEGGLLYVGTRLLIPNDKKIRELLYHLAHDSLGHFGFTKSYAALRDSYYWPHMCRDLEAAYIPSCVECQRNKARTTKPTGPLHPLPVPDARFDTVALDFVGPLPPEDGFDMILTITDTLGADIHIIPIKSTISAPEVATILFNEWYCENGLMLNLISDRDALFTSEVWQELHKLTGVRLKMSTAYHPETDGSSERTNKTITQAIRYHVDVNQKGWVKTLPRVRFAIMNTVNASTGFTPFQLKTGRSPRLIPPLAPAANDATPAQISAQEVIDRINLDVSQAQDALVAAKIRQAYHANEQRAPEIRYKIDDLVMLSTENRRRNYKRKGAKRVAKFMPRFDGPYTIVDANPDKSTYTLRLPNSQRTYPGFHAKLLKPFHPNNDAEYPDRALPRPGIVITEDGTEEVLVDKIVDERNRGRGKQYLVRWVGYGKEHDEWISGKDLENNEALDVWERAEAPETTP